MNVWAVLGECSTTLTTTDTATVSGGMYASP